MSTYGYLREDDDGHWYLIPEDKVGRFLELKDKIYMSDFESESWESACDAMYSEFDIYRLSGGPYDLRIKMEE